VLVNRDGVVSPFYEVTHKSPPRVPVRNQPLTESELAHLRGVLDRQFVLAAEPAVDGIQVLQDRRTWWAAEWDVPASVASLRFKYRCAATDEFVIEVEDITPGKAVKKTDKQTIDCSGADATVDFPDPPDKVVIRTAVHERRTNLTAVPNYVMGPFVVELVPIS
jgi:hypothetical protein